MKRVLVALTAVLLTAGCSFGGNAGAAAVVGDKQISAKEVASHVNTVRTEIEHTNPELLQDVPGMTQISRMVVDRLILEEILGFAANDMKIKISDAQVAEYRETIFRNYGEEAIVAQLSSRNGVQRADVDSFMYDILLQREIMAQIAPGMPEEIQAPALYKYLSGIVQKQGVKVSPRYGSWDPQTMQTAANENYLSTTTPALVQ